MHKFYSKSRKQQNKILLLNGLLIFLFFSFFILIAAYCRLYVFIILAGLFLSVFACFIDVPLGKRKGVYIYHSPLLFSTKEKNRQIELHGGTLFDYFYTIDRKLSSRERKKLIIGYYLEGLLNLCGQYGAENEKEGKKMTLRATSYIINERTAAKIGFRKAKADALQTFTIIMNFLPILLAHSYANGRLSIPKIIKVSTYEAPLINLLENREKISQLKNRL